MRVISGTARGSKLNTIESTSTRPTLDRVKESLFNILQNDIKDRVVLDLFAGSGALGIETLSRGAKYAWFCDNNPDAIRVIKQNIVKTHFEDKSEVINKDYSRCLQILLSNIEKGEDKLGLVFIDPPYKADIAVKSVKFIVDNKMMNEDGIIVIETDEAERDLEELSKIDSIKITDQRKYGRANLIFIGV